MQVPSTSLKVKKVTRIPERQDARRDNTKPRPLRVEFEDQESKVKALKGAREIANHDQWKFDAPHGLGGVYVQADRTRAERARDFELRQEKRVRTQNGEADLVIRDNRVVTRAEADAMQQQRGQRGARPWAVAGRQNAHPRRVGGHAGAADAAR